MQSNNVTVATVPSPQRPFFQNKFSAGSFQKTPGFFQNNQQFRQQANAAQAIEFDGKRLRKAVARKTVDYNASIVKYLETRTWQRDYRDRRALQPDVGYSSELMPPMSYLDNPVNAITTKFVRTSTNKMRCPIFCVVWTPEGRRLITGASSGEFTLWNGLTFNFETILQAHDSPVRCMVWSHNDIWMVTGDHSGYVKYWQSNMNNVKMFQAHKEPLRGLSFCPTDTKFVTCSDDGTVRIWDFLRCHEERILRGHGADVKCVSWHPQKSLIVSGSKDSQQPIKLWDPKSGQSLATLHAHKSTVMEVKWNQNGTWMLTASRDHLLKLFDIRNMSQEVQTFRGHKKEACSISWHPIHESMFVSGGSDGSVMFWVVGADKEVGSMEQAHESCVWSLGWHPLGHILCTGSNDHTSKFWTRNRPGDRMRDKYNLNTLPRGQDETAEYDEPSSGAIPGMGLDLFGDGENDDPDYTPAIPGLDFGTEDSIKNGNSTVHVNTTSFQHSRKVPFSKPIPRQFQQQWMENKQPLLLAPPPNAPNDINQTQQQQSQGLNQPPLQPSSTMGSMLPSGALLPQGGPPPPLQMGNMGGQSMAPNLPGGPMLPGNMLPSAALLPQGGPPPPMPMGNMGGQPMAPNLPGGPLLPNIQNMSGTIMPTMQNNPDNQMIMGDMSNRQNLLPTRPMGDFQGGTQPTGGNNPNFVMNQQGTPMLQPNMQMTGNQFVPAPNMFMPPRPQLDQQQNNETFGPRANQIMMQRQASLASRPNESDNVSSMDNRPNVNVSVSSPISNIGDNRNSQMSSGTGNKPPEERVSDWRNKISGQLDTDSRNVSADNSQSTNMTGNIGPNIPQFNYMPQQNQQFHQQPQMMQNEQRFGGNEFDDRLSSQSNFNRNNNNMPGRGGGMMPNQIHQQNSNFQPHNQFSGNFQDHDNMRYMGNSDYGDMPDNNMRKRQWDEGPGDMGGGLPEMGGNIPQMGQMGGNIPQMGQMGGNIPQMGGNIPQMGGNIPQMGGNIPQMGGNIPQMGGNIPQMGGNIPQMGGNLPQMGGNIPQMGGNIPQMGGNNPQMGGNNPQMGGNNPQMGGNNPQMGGNIPHQQQMGAPHQQMGGNGFFNQSQGGFQNRNMGNMNNMNNRGPPPSSRGGYMRGGGGGGGRGMMGPQRGGHNNRPFRGNFRGNRGNMRGNSNF